MLGAIAGDIIGSRFERDNAKQTDFQLFTKSSTFTDDTVMTIAVADACLNNIDYKVSLQYWGQQFPDVGYGKSFRAWLKSSCPKPYGSWGNGSAMRVSPIGWSYDNLNSVLKEAEKTAIVSHNHNEGVKGAQAIAAAIFLARNKKSKSHIKKHIEYNFEYNLSRRIKDIAKDYKFDVSCQGSVPQAITAFLESTDFESAIRLAISIGGDSDTIACMAGAIAEAYYQEIPVAIKDEVMYRLPLKMNLILKEFYERYMK